MMKMFRRICPLLAVLILLTGCSTQESLRDLTLVTPEPEGTQILPDGTSLPDGTDTGIDSDMQPETTPLPVLPLSPTTGLTHPSPHGVTAVAFDAERADLSGISQADVVYEFFPEGETARCLIALYHDNIPETVSPLGPVYGYAVPYLKAWQPETLYGFGHDATQSESARAITRLSAFGIDFADAAGSQDENLTYDAETSSAAAKIAPVSSAQAPVSALDLSAAAEPFSRMAYTVLMDDWVYRYDELTGLYSRYVDGSDAKDASGSVLTCRNVIFLRSLYTYRADSAHCDITLAMGGEADIFSQGSGLYGHWTYDEATGKITLLDENNQTVELAPGTTWIHVVNEDAGVDFE